MGVVRKTKHLEQVLQAFRQSGDALSAGMLLDVLDNAINKSTVYRMLDKLEDDGVIHSFLTMDRFGFTLCVRAVQVDAMLTATPIFSALPASVFPVSQRRLSCQSLKRHASQVPKSCLQGNASPACLEDTCPSFPWSQSEKSQRTNRG